MPLFINFLGISMKKLWESIGALLWKEKDRVTEDDGKNQPHEKEKKTRTKDCEKNGKGKSTRIVSYDDKFQKQ